MISIIELKKYLKNKSSEELTEEIVELFKNNTQVKEYYNNKFSDSTEVIDKYKTIIEKKIFPSKSFSNPGLHLADAKKAISDFTKIAKNKSDIADIMLFYVETGVKLTRTFGDINESFYDSMANMYEKTVKFIFKNKLENEFRNRCWSIVDRTKYIGWGFGDSVSDTFDEYFGNVD